VSIERQMDAEPAVAVFDLDGTLVGRASIARFVCHLAGPAGTVRALGHGVLGLCVRPRRAQFKTAALRRVLHGRPLIDVRRQGRRFAHRLMRSHLSDDMVANLRRHRRAGHHLVLLTSALDVYAEPLGAELGFDAVIAARVIADGAGVCTGQVLDPHLVGREKAAALERHLLQIGFDPATVPITAYADGRSDRPLVEWAGIGPPRPAPAPSMTDASRPPVECCPVD
jgi:HAD superfamily hydrolase (TIGR01490 family)